MIFIEGTFFGHPVFHPDENITGIHARVSKRRLGNAVRLSFCIHLTVAVMVVEVKSNSRYYQNSNQYITVQVP